MLLCIVLVCGLHGQMHAWPGVGCNCLLCNLRVLPRFSAADYLRKCRLPLGAAASSDEEEGEEGAEEGQEGSRGGAAEVDEEEDSDDPEVCVLFKPIQIGAVHNACCLPLVLRLPGRSMTGRPAMSGHCCSAAELISLPANAPFNCQDEDFNPSSSSDEEEEEQGGSQRQQQQQRSGGSKRGRAAAAEGDAGWRPRWRGVGMCGVLAVLAQRTLRRPVGSQRSLRPLHWCSLVHQPLARSAPCAAEGEEEEEEDEDEEEAEESSEEEDSSDEDGSVELVGCFLCLGCCPAWLGKWAIEGC